MLPRRSPVSNRLNGRPASAPLAPAGVVARLNSGNRGSAKARALGRTDSSSFWRGNTQGATRGQGGCCLHRACGANGGSRGRLCGSRQLPEKARYRTDDKGTVASGGYGWGWTFG